MDFHKELFKLHRPSLIEEWRTINRSRQREARKDNFSNNRVISVSQTPKKSEFNGKQTQSTSTSLKGESQCLTNKLEQSKGAKLEDKENVTPRITLPQDAKKEVITRKDLYIKRYLEWRKAKKEEALRKKNSNKNLIWKPVGNGVIQSLSTCFVPSSCKFRPPKGLRHPKLVAPTEPADVIAGISNKRDSLYVPIKTPQKSTLAASKKIVDKTHKNVFSDSKSTVKLNSWPCVEKSEKPYMATNLRNKRTTNKIEPTSAAPKSLLTRRTANKPMASQLAHKVKGAECASSHKCPRLGRQLKAKKPTNTSIKNDNCAVTAFKRPRVFKKKEKLILTQTPSTCKQENQFMKLITSTHIKAVGSKNLCQALCFNEISSSEFNETAATAGNALINPKKTVQEDVVQVNGVYQQLMDDAPSGWSTPRSKYQSISDRSANNLSTYVSVSRGKVRARVERERRNIVFLNTDNKETTQKWANEAKSEENMTSVEVRRTLESVRYFRQQLQDETTRLRTLCKQWRLYKSMNLELLQKMNCDDKIDATIGQTQLLTDNKFQQFNGLIIRCEECATGVLKVHENGSTDSKLVQASDLEGFWAMLCLQIDNINERFGEIDRWKFNGWSDPDTLKQAMLKGPKPKLTKVSKPKAKEKAVKPKPSSGLQELMRIKYAEISALRAAKASAETLIKNSNSNSSKNIDLEQVASSSQNKAPQRRMVVVPNCKQFSQARTILSFKERISTSNRQNSLSNKIDTLPKTPIRDLSAKNRNSVERVPPKSIMKTPKSGKKYKFVFTIQNFNDEDEDDETSSLGSHGQKVME